MKVPRVHRVKKNGKVFRYHRITRAPLPDLPEEHPDFLDAWSYEERQTQTFKGRAKPGSLAALAQGFQKSEIYAGFSPGYRQIIKRGIDAIVAKGGDTTASTIRAEHIQRNIANLPPHAANARLKAWRALCAWGVENGKITTNPATGTVRKRLPSSDGHIPWSDDEIAAYREGHPVGTPLRLAFEILFWTGCRISDAVTLGDHLVDKQGWLTFVPKKTQKSGLEVSIPFRRELPEIFAHMQPDLDILHQCLDARADKHMIWLTTIHGKPRSSWGFNNWFNASTPEGRTAHGLRKSRAIHLANAGASSLQVGSWTGHVTLSEIERYTKRFDRRQALSPRAVRKE